MPQLINYERPGYLLNHPDHAKESRSLLSSRNTPWPWTIIPPRTHAGPSAVYHETSEIQSIYLFALPPPIYCTHSPSVNFDLTLPPPNTSTNHRGFSRHTLLESATKTPLSALTLISPHLSWSIEVTAPYGTYVTVHDVLDGIYRSLRANISSNDFRALRQKDQNRVTIAFEQRCLRSKKPEYERRMGVRRVDFLMGYTMFTGLTATNKGHDVWVLNTE